MIRMEEKIVIPKIIFDPSWFYNQFLKEIIGEPYASDQEILEYKEKMEALWDKKKEGILEELALISGLKWRRTEITCFVVGAPKLAYWSAFSHPLTMTLIRYKESPDRFLITLIHELIHNLFVDNENIYGKE
jgi:hypothetical protein